MVIECEPQTSEWLLILYNVWYCMCLTHVVQDQIQNQLPIFPEEEGLHTNRIASIISPLLECLHVELKPK